jgi:ABC-type branched-subunit amino acid transport system substrate-binding protein
MSYFYRFISGICIFVLVHGCAGYSFRQQPVITNTNIQKREQNTSETVYKQPPPETLETSNKFKTLFYTPSANKVKIALLLPLTGKYSHIGRGLLDASQLALFSLHQDGFSLMPIDTKGTTFGAVEAAKKAVSEGATLVLGPVFSSSARSVSPIFEEENINFVTFSNDESLADSGALMIGVSPQQQVRRVMQYTIEQMGIADYTVLAPNNALGAAAAKLVRETVNEYIGTSLLKTEIYLINRSGRGVRLKKHVDSVLYAMVRPPIEEEKEDATGEEDTTLQSDELEPVVKKALLVEGSVDDLKRIASYVVKSKWYDPKKIQLIGTMRMNDPSLFSLSAYQGTVLAALPQYRKDNFIKKFSETYSYEPVSIASLAYDGVALAATLAKTTSDNSFSREMITNPRGFSGVDGIFRIKGNGLSERGLSVVQIDQGEVVEVMGAPSSFFDVKP